MFSKPRDGAVIPAPTRVYFKSRSRQKLYSALLREIREKNVSQAEIARRLGKDPSQISRALSAPRNLTIDTAAEILFAVAGGAFEHRVEYPLDNPRTNDRGLAGVIEPTIQGRLRPGSNPAVRPAPATIEFEST